MPAADRTMRMNSLRRRQRKVRDDIAGELAGPPCERQVNRGRAWVALRGEGGHVRSRYMSPMGLYAGLNGNNVRHFRCVDREKLWEVTMRKLFWLLALACLPTVALAQNAGPDWAYPVAPAGGPPRDANKILKVPGSDKTYNEVSANDAFAPPDWFPSE